MYKLLRYAEGDQLTELAYVLVVSVSVPGGEVGAMELSVLKFDFFKILTDHECFIPINLPLPYELHLEDISCEVRLSAVGASSTKAILTFHPCRQ
jgi:hypothetical protein